MTPAENEFIERQFEHLFRTDDCTLCDRAIRDNVLIAFATGPATFGFVRRSNSVVAFSGR